MGNRHVTSNKTSEGSTISGDTGTFTSTQEMTNHELKTDLADIVFDMLSPKDKINYCKSNKAACESRIIRYFGEEKVKELSFEKEGERPVPLLKQLISAFELESDWNVSYSDGQKMYTGEKSRFSTSPLKMKVFIDESMSLDTSMDVWFFPEQNQFLESLRIKGIKYDYNKLLLCMKSKPYYDAWRIITCTNEKPPDCVKIDATELNKVRKKIRQFHRNIWPSLAEFSNLSNEDAMNKYGASENFMEVIKQIDEIIKENRAIENIHDFTSDILDFEHSVVNDVLEFLFLSSNTYDMIDIYTCKAVKVYLEIYQKSNTNLTKRQKLRPN